MIDKYEIVDLYRINTYSKITKVRASHSRFKLNTAFKKIRRGNCNDALPIVSAPMGVDVFIYHCTIVVANSFYFFERLPCGSSQVRGRIVNKETFDGHSRNNISVPKRHLRPWSLVMQALFRLLWPAQMA